MTKIYAKISGTGMYVPEKVVTNFDLEKIMDTTDEWIYQRSGIKERRLISNGQSTSDLAEKAALNAIESAGLKNSDIDLVMVATLSPDYQFPGVSTLLQAKLGLGNKPSFDLRNQCSGFIYSLNVAKMFIENGQYKNVLVVGAEAHSPFMDWSTRGRDMAVLFGDGAGAVILSATTNPEEGKLGPFILHSDGSYAEKLLLQKPGTKGGVWVEKEDFGSTRMHPSMDGKLVFTHAVRGLVSSIKDLCEQNKIDLDKVDHFLFHQANIRINEKVAEQLKIPSNKIPSNIEKYGNTSAATIPILLDESVKSGRIKRKDKIITGAFGAGFTWAVGYLEY